MIQVLNLHKSYATNNTNAVSDLNLQVQKGEFYGLLGANGAGKTTTIAMLCGILKPNTGSILIDGKNIEEHHEYIKQHFGVVPQDLALYSALNAYENLRFVGKMYDIPKLELEAKIEKYIDLFGLKPYAKRKLGTYSGGMKRKVNLIAGILHDPKLVFLDEPTVGIDIQSKKLIIDFLKDLHTKGTTIIYTSHNMEEAEMLCTRIGILNLGKLILEGTPNELTALNPKFHKLENLLLHLAEHGEISLNS
ncbi:ABC-type multidrug transport system, ATPase component [Owenweeksia hongkongensis DSM 17368]|uniref:ABC-type multidrug transport system, ATPase component n=1 Tax=Owenweeksia hongkongensis (strain DSM 17368 / CIP 108786 / JCM 12287 / NRRL B-23963 / UST20020801) TaxID=926562 RepID=G8R7E1_OWEHD|nr:ABC transporter ATP-binding protein [Owenweeksia hongkongensis]AEV31252.1 ABC-type multidrug transport system, ATPase component [Owenweeksia hongkongensis DSM 17368]